MRQRFFLPILILSLSASAEIYKCTDASGKLSFSDKPCGNNTEVITVDTQQSSGIGLTAGGDWSKVKASNERRDIQRSIQEHQNRIARYSRRQENELSVLRRKRAAANNNGYPESSV